MRFPYQLLFVFFVAVSASPAYSQAIFGRTKLDLEQNERLDNLERYSDARHAWSKAKFEELNRKTDAIEAKLRSMEKVEDEPATVAVLAERMETLESSLSALAARPATPEDSGPDAGTKSGEADRTTASVAGPVTSVRSSPVPAGGLRYSTAELRSLIQRFRPNGWDGPIHADVSPRSAVWDHLVGAEHGFTRSQVSGLSQSEAMILHDLAPGHGGQITPFRGGSQPLSRVADASGCPDGQCPLQPVSSGCAGGQCPLQSSSGQTRTITSPQRSGVLFPRLRRLFR